MKKSLKRVLAAMLTLVMVVTLVPTTAMATDTEDEPVVQSLTMGTKPEDGTTSSEPFPQGTGGSNSFRIPAMVTLSDGTLVAAADARWNTTYDGGGLDTIVSRSSDDGATWNYTFANYLGDNGNVYDGDASTAFIDPALAVAGDTIYMLVDIYPYGVALNGSGNTAPVKTKGFDSDGHLLLSGNNHSSYGYYLDGNTIYSSDGTPVSEYTVDEYFNITGTDGTSTNLFFSDSPYKVVRTGFLYLTKSTDGGKNWSAPELLNLKTSSEQVCLVAPGRGLVTSNGNIIFPVYSYNGSQESQTMSYISMDADTGVWSRSTDMTGASWSSESAVVELESGALRFFYRNGTTNLCYVDYNNGWGTPVVMSGIDTNSNCQISAITYSKTIDGKQVILVSCPTGPSEAGSDQSGASYRKNGKIFAFTVESDGTLTKVGSVNVTSNDNQFMYSCMTELDDGTVGILYEDKENAWGAGSNCYYTMSYGEYDLVKDMGLTFDDETTDEEEDDTTTENVVTVVDEDLTIKSEAKVTEIDGLTDFVAYDVTLAKNGTDYTGSATVTIPLNGKFAEDAELWGFVVETDGSITYVKDDVSRDTVNDTFTFTSPHFSTVGVTLAAEDTSDTTITNTVDVRIAVGETAEYTDTTGNYKSSYTGEGLEATIAAVSVEGNTVAAGSTVTALTSLTTGDTFYIQVSDGVYLTADCETTTDLTAAETWTAWYVASSYCTVRNSDNEYLGVNYSGDPYTSTSTLYLKMSNGQLVGYYSNYAAGTPVKVTATEAVDATDITIKGISQGSTSVVVGTTRYNITVYAPRNIIVTYQVNGTTVKSDTMVVESDAETAALPEIIVGTDGSAYRVDNTTLTLVSGTANYTVTVTKIDAIAVEVEEDAAKTLSLDYTLTDGQYVVWTSADTSYVSVAENYDSDGSYTNKGTIIGNAVTEEDGAVLVTGTVYNADGTAVYASSWLVTVTEGTGNSNTTSKYIYIDIVRIQNTTVYYNINGGELIEITDDMLEGPYTDDNGTYYKLKVALKDEQYTGGFQISFYAAPDEGYALTYMSSTNSDSEYYCLSDGNLDGVGSDAWPFVDGYDYDSFDALETKPAGNNTAVFDTSVGLRWGLVEGNFTVAQMKVMFANALSKGCDGVLVFTKNNTGTTNGSTSNYGDNDLVTDLQFVSQKLPEMDKKIVSITHSDGTVETYKDGMTLALGDTINYAITVYEPTAIEDYGEIEYSNIKLVDPLTGDTWTTKSNTYTTGDYTFTNSATGESITMNATAYTYTPTSLTLAVTNLLELVDDNGNITNTASLEYNYSSEYSQGTLDANADAAAQAKVEVPEYVIDFGLPVKFNLTNNPLIEGYETIVGATAQYGTVTCEGLTVTYTPTSILQGSDFIRLTIADEAGSTDNIGYGIRIYPATTVHYEESFLTWGSNWTGGNGAITVAPQATEQLNKSTDSAATSDNGKQYNYGYDPVYANTAGASNGTNAITSTIGAKATFTFTGDGIQIFANSTESTGYVAVEVKNSSGKIVSLSMVDTVVDEGTTNATSGQSGDLYGLPIVSLVDLQNMTHDTYTVTLTKIMDTDTVYIDGIRVFNTMADSTIFKTDLEDNPDFYELRDAVLYGIGVGDDTSVDYKTMYEQVYDEVEGAVALITDESVTYGNSDTVQDLLDNGPKNEIYLYAKQTLTFKVSTNRVMQLGMKAPQGSTAASISVDGGTTTTSQTIGSSVDMFYTLADKTDSETTYTVQVTNTGDKILSITELKICDDPNFTFVPFTEEDIKNILTKEETPSEPEVEYADATLNINLTDASGEALASTVLTTNGVVGEKATFTANEIKEEAASILPSGYELKNASYEDVEVAYGESDSVNFTAAKKAVYKNATVKIVLKDGNGKTVATKKLTAKGEVGKSKTFTGTEIKNAAKSAVPKNYQLKTTSFRTRKVAYGEEVTVTAKVARKVAYAKVKLVIKNSSGKVLATKTLSAKGYAGKSKTFTAAQIKSAVKSMKLPKGYKLSKTTYKKVTVAYGNTKTVTYKAKK